MKNKFIASQLFLICLFWYNVGNTYTCIDLIDINTSGKLIDVEGFESISIIDDKAQGFGRIKQNPVFSNLNEALRVREILQKSPKFQFNTGRFSPENYEAILKKGKEVFGEVVALKLINYVKLIEQLVNEKTESKYEISFLVRTEKSKTFPDGHFHNYNTLTVTRAELGETSWLEPYKIGGERISFNEPDDATVFTNEYHGGTASAKPRLLIIVFFKFLKK